MSANLIAELAKIPDFRTTDGRRHQLWVVLLIVIMGTMSGYLGYRAWGDFVKRHQSVLIESLKLPKGRVPSYSTIRRVMMGINYEQLTDIFNAWASQYVDIETPEWLSLDGKAIRGTVTDSSSSSQNFLSLVSLFSHRTGVVVALESWQNKQGSEIATVQTLISALKLEGIILSLDALHCQKKLAS